MAVGPRKCSAMEATSDPSAALRRIVFFTTWYSHSPSPRPRSRERSSFTDVTSRPR
jgi:hypothetical protein